MSGEAQFLRVCSEGGRSSASSATRYVRSSGSWNLLPGGTGSCRRRSTNSTRLEQINNNELWRHACRVIPYSVDSARSAQLTVLKPERQRRSKTNETGLAQRQTPDRG